MSSRKGSLNYSLIAIVVLALALVLSVYWAVYERNQAKQAVQPSTEVTVGRQGMSLQQALDEHGIVLLTDKEASNSKSTADELAFMIEEEKLAYDIYQAMYDKWGIRAFSNIKNSETTHQNMLLAVMQARNLPDPRQAEPGKFSNADLQKLYDDLLEQGLKSQVEALRVGVLVEETDIADLKKALDNIDAKDTDVKQVLEALIQGSENHLRAFNRQLDRRL